MPTHSRAVLMACCAAGVAACALPARADTLTVTPSKDNVLFMDEFGSASNGAGLNLFIGNNAGGLARRAVLRFNLAAIPKGSTITSASLQMHMNRTRSLPDTVEVHRLLADWGEGTSNSNDRGGGGGAPPTTNDATWIHTFFPGSFWATPGGDFVSSASASVVQGAAIAFHTWNGQGMVRDVQQWVNYPTSNFGWVMIGDENNNPTARRYDSRHTSVVANRPTLTVVYSPPPPKCNLADITGIGGPPAPSDMLNTGDDFVAFINAFVNGDTLYADICGVGGPPTPPDGLITGDDFNAFISAFATGCP